MKARPSIGAGFRRLEDGISLAGRGAAAFQLCRGATSTCAKAFTYRCSFEVAWPGAAGAIAPGPAAGVARRRCLALGWIYRRRRMRPMRRQNGWPSATAFRFLKLKCAMRRQLPRKRPRNLKRPSNRSKREPGPSAKSARPGAPRHHRSRWHGRRWPSMSGKLPSGWRRPARWMKASAASRNRSTKCAPALKRRRRNSRPFRSLEGLAQEVAALRDNVNRERAAYAEARAKHDGLEREAKARAERLATLEAERNQWGERAKRATEQIAASDNARRGNPRSHCRACRRCRKSSPTSAAS